MRIDPRLARLAPLALIAAGLALGACGRSSPAPVVFGGPSAGPATAAPAPAPRARPDVAAASRTGTVTVAAGDTLYSIARRHGVALRDLIERNRLAPPYRLREGRVLALPKARTHRVAAGDTLYAISRRYGVDIYTVAAVNRIDPPYTIRVGQQLRIPDRHRRTRAGPAAAPGVATGTAAAPARTVTQAQPARTAKPAVPALDPGAKPKPVPRAPAARSQARFLWPLRGAVISRFGPKAGGLHNDGINIAASTGAPIVAAEDGVVAYAGNELRGFGNLLLVRHAGGWTTAYAHGERLLVKRGDRVRKGDVIARVGATGRVQRPQLHFELRRGTDAVDPLRFLAPVPAATG